MDLCPWALKFNVLFEPLHCLLLQILPPSPPFIFWIHTAEPAPEMQKHLHGLLLYSVTKH